MLDSLHAWGGFPKRLLLGEADVTAHSYLYKTSYNAAHRHGHIGVHYTTCKLLSLACWCRAHLVEWSHQGFGRFLLQYGNRAPFSCPFQQTSGQYRSLSCQSVQTWRNLTYSMTKLFTESPNAYQMRPTHCAPYQYYFDRNSCLMVACQYFDICIWRECCNAVMSICRSMEGVKKHPSICLLLSAMKIHNICCGHSTLKGVTFGTSVSVSDVQYTVSNLLSISLVGSPLMDKNVQQTLFIATSGHSCCGLVMLTASWPLLPLLSLSLCFLSRFQDTDHVRSRPLLPLQLATRFCWTPSLPSQKICLESCSASVVLPLHASWLLTFELVDVGGCQHRPQDVWENNCFRAFLTLCRALTCQRPTPQKKSMDAV